MGPGVVIWGRFDDGCVRRARRLSRASSIREPLRKSGVPKHIGRISGDMSWPGGRTVKQGARGRKKKTVGESSSRPAQWFRTVRDVKAVPSGVVGRTTINYHGRFAVALPVEQI